MKNYTRSRRGRRALRILITAGATREYLDPVRYLSNESSGKMGVALARAARVAGHRVTLIHGPLSVPISAQGCRALAVVSARDMLRECEKAWPDHDVLIMAAAVADYGVAKMSPRKLKRTRGVRRLSLTPNPDVVATLAATRRADQVVIGFALQDRAGKIHATSKLVKKNLDAIVLNSLGALGADRSEASVLVSPGLAAALGVDRRWRDLPRGSKSRLAVAIVRWAGRLHLAREKSAPRRGSGTSADKLSRAALRAQRPGDQV